MILPLVVYGHDALRSHAQPVPDGTDVSELVRDMVETLNAAGGVGLAANQVNRPEAVVIISINGEAVALVNPAIVEREGIQRSEEGCLSIPGVYAEIDRADKIVVHARNMHGEDVELRAGGVISTIIQHEVDHLEGRLFTDYLSAVKKMALRSAIVAVEEGYGREHTIKPEATAVDAMLRRAQGLIDASAQPVERTSEIAEG